MSDKKISVSAKALRELLVAVSGPAHYIREIQATRDMPLGMSDDNPINILTEQFNEQVKD